MKKRYTALLLSLLLMCHVKLWAFENTPSGAIEEPAYKRAAETVKSYFKPSAGIVADIAGKTVTVKFNESADLKKGMRLSVFRQGKPFHHPVTNELIGYAEELAGRVEATGEKVTGGVYSFTVISGNIKAGDSARVTASKIKLAFFQERKSDWELSEAFYGLLKDSGRFEILESYTPSYSPGDLSRVAGELNAEIALLFSTPVRDEKRFLNIKLYWAEDAGLLAELEEEVSQAAGYLQSPEEKFIYESLAEKEPWGSYNLAGGQLFAMGDVDGNGASELVVADGSSIRIHSLKDELRETWFISGAAGERYISIDALDLNNNGRAEIFITSLTGDTAIKTDGDKINVLKAGDMAIRSFVLEFDPAEGYRKIKDNIPYFLRVSGRKLLMQKFDGRKVFSGPVYEADWKDGDYQPGKQLVLPSDANIYGFTFTDWQNNGRLQVMTFDDRGYLLLYDQQGHPVWKSSKSYGKFPLSFETETSSTTAQTMKWVVRSRLIPVKTGAGEEIIAVNSLPLVARVPGFGTKGAEVYSLWWDGFEMHEKLILSNVPGAVTDYWVEGGKLFLLAKGDLMSFVKNALTGELSKGSMLYYYNFGEK